MAGDNRVDAQAAIDHINGRGDSTPKQTYLVEEVAALFDCRIQTVQAWCRTGKLRATKGPVNGSRQYKYTIARGALEEFVNDYYIKRGTK